MTSLVLLRIFFLQIHTQRLVFDFSISCLIQGGRPCLGTDKTCASHTCRAMVLHQRSLQSTFMLVHRGNYAMFLFILQGWCEREVKRNWDQTEIEDKGCFQQAGLSINRNRHTCSLLKHQGCIQKEDEQTPPVEADILQCVQQGAGYFLLLPVHCSLLWSAGGGRLSRLIRKAGSMIGCKLDTVESVLERRTLNKLLPILDNPDRPLHPLLDRQRSSFSNRLVPHLLLTETLSSSCCDECCLFCTLVGHFSFISDIVHLALL